MSDHRLKIILERCPDIPVERIYEQFDRLFVKSNTTRFRAEVHIAHRRPHEDARIAIPALIDWCAEQARLILQEEIGLGWSMYVMPAALHAGKDINGPDAQYVAHILIVSLVNQHGKEWLGVALINAQLLRPEEVAAIRLACQDVRTRRGIEHTQYTELDMKMSTVFFAAAHAAVNIVLGKPTGATLQ